LAGAGQADYSLELGRVREGFAFRSNTYGAMLASGTYRFGISSATTVDGQFAQLGNQQSLLGLGVLEGLGRFGQVSARIANSRDADGSGWLARMGYDYERDKLSVALRTHIQSSTYQMIGDISQVEPLRQRTLASAGWDLGSIGKFSVASATQTFIDDSRRDVVALGHAIPLYGGGMLSTAAAYAPGDLASSALFLSVIYPFGTASASTRALQQQIDITLDRTIGDALQNRLFAYPKPLWGAGPDLGAR
jgi:outer membrane usher protein